MPDDGLRPSSVDPMRVSKKNRILIAIIVLIACAAAFLLCQKLAYGMEEQELFCRQQIIRLADEAGLCRSFTLGELLSEDDAEIVFALCVGWQRSYGDSAIFSAGDRPELHRLDSGCFMGDRWSASSDADRLSIERIASSREALALARKFVSVATLRFSTNPEEWQVEQESYQFVRGCSSYKLGHPEAGSVVIGVTAIKLDGQFTPKVVGYEVRPPRIE